MKKTIIAFFSITFLLFGCESDSNLVNDWISHSCKLNEIQVKLNSDPDNAELKAEYIDYSNYLEDVINTESGDKEALRQAIKEGSKNCGK